MTREELRPEYTSFALGIAGEPESSEIAAHLARQCPNCLPGVTNALATGLRHVRRGETGGATQAPPPPCAGNGGTGSEKHRRQSPETGTR